MRRTLIAVLLLGALVAPALRPSTADAQDGGHVATCALASYTLTGAFNRVGGATTFNLSASGTCLGTASAVVVGLSFNSIGPWSCDAGVAHGAGGMTATTSNGPVSQTLDGYLVNAGGEYIVSVTGGGTAVGQFTTLPVQCDLGQTQATVGGTGTLTFSA